MTISNFLQSLNTVQTQWTPYQKWDKEWNDREEKRKALYNKVVMPQKDIEHAKKLSRTIDDIVEKMDENSENTSQNIESVISPLSSIASFGVFAGGVAGFLLTAKKWKNKTAQIVDEQLKTKTNKRYMAGMTGILTGIPLAMIAVDVGASVLGSRLQLLGSRIAHYQSQQDLSDPKNFVLYDEDQIKKAQGMIKSGNITENKISQRAKSGFFGNLFSIIHDYKDFKKWESEQHQEINLAKTNPTPEELIKAKSDQNAILRAVKAINEKSQDYSESMDSSAGTILNSSLVGGATIGVIADKIIENIKIGKEKKSLANHLADTIIDTKITDLLGPYKEIANTALRNNKSRAAIVGVASSFLAAALTFPLTQKLKRQASRVGRFIARKELENDDKSSIYYDEKQMELVKDVQSNKKPKTVLEGVFDDVKFIPKSIKESAEYEKYKKTTRKENKKLREALKYVDLKPGQIEEAKNLQRKIFMSFRKVDEKSQELSESMEAFINSVQSVIPLIFVTLIAAPAVAFLSKMNIGKIDYKSIIDKFNSVSKSQKILGATALIAKFVGLYALNSYLAEIQKRSGKIGVMEALSTLNDPRYFVDKYPKEKEIASK